MVLFHWFGKLLQSLVFLLGQTHERTLLRTGDSLDIHGVGEVAHIAVGLADAVMFWF